jgi:hypothetical protein
MPWASGRLPGPWACWGLAGCAGSTPGTPVWSGRQECLPHPGSRRLGRRSFTHYKPGWQWGIDDFEVIPGDMMDPTTATTFTRSH